MVRRDSILAGLLVLGLCAISNALPSTLLWVPRKPVALVLKWMKPDIATITSIPTSSYRSYHTENLRRYEVRKLTIASGLDSSNQTAGSGWNCTTTPVLTWGDVDSGGIGVTITNGDTDWRAFFVYHNKCDDWPYKYIWVRAGTTEFVSLPAAFEGRIVRGNNEWNLGGIPRPLGTWFEFALDNQSWIWGDVSLIRGCDGAVLMWATDSSGAWKGFTQWILDGAPSGAYDTKPSGQQVLAATENWNGSANPVPRDWEIAKIGTENVYVDDGHGNPVITSTNGRFGTYWAAGRI